MKRIILIADFSPFIKDKFDVLTEHFNVQLCGPDMNVIFPVLDMTDPDLILYYLNELDENAESIFAGIAAKYPSLPMVFVSNESNNLMLDANYRFTSASFILDNAPMSVVINRIAVLLGIKEIKEDDMMRDDRPHILFIDDDPLLLRSMKRMIDTDYRVSVVTSVVDALKLMVRETPDLIFIDYEMPVIDGVEGTRLIKKEEKNKNIPVVFLSGKSENEESVELEGLDIKGYLMKPPVKAQILKTITDNL